ncbi:MAG: pilin, partial [Candidatus Contendobacter sp.]|nr:pilin [Candidatus Contendobacter sp.]MDG4556769.1 pilin [Candidatus Contendobacter sp.]
VIYINIIWLPVPAKTREPYSAFSTTSPNRHYGTVKTLNQVTLTPPRRWRLSPCNYPLVGKNFWGRVRRKELSKSLPAYYLPEQKEEIRTSFFFDNDYYCCDLKPEEVISPVIKTVGFFSHRLSSRLSICGPELAVRYGDRIGYGKDLEIESNATARKVPGGWLVKGAWIGEFRNPNGQCGACENVYLNLHFVPDSGGPPQSAFQMWDIPSGCCWNSGSVEQITLSDDFQRIRVKKIFNEAQTNEAQTEETTELCFDVTKHVYVKCRTEADMKPRQTQQIPPPTQESEWTIRAQVSESLTMVDRIKVEVLKYYKSNGRFPIDNAAASIVKPENLIQNYVAGIRVEEGAIHIQFGNRADQSIAGKWLSLQPVIVNADPEGPISWWCGYAPSIGGMTAQGRNMTSVSAIHLPEECRPPPTFEDT